MQGRAARRLAALAQPLAPERAPYYVRRSMLPPSLRAHFPADGWYWVPREHPVAVFAGASEVDVAVMLYRLQDQDDAA